VKKLNISQIGKRRVRTAAMHYKKIHQASSNQKESVTKKDAENKIFQKKIEPCI